MKKAHAASFLIVLIACFIELLIITKKTKFNPHCFAIIGILISISTNLKSKIESDNANAQSSYLEFAIS